jgi:succinate dehydrogenase/fumarate reductase flavoprotein subunit
MVHHDHLHCLSRSYPTRTAESMSTALLQAPTMSKTQRNEFLKSHGLHDFEVSSDTTRFIRISHALPRIQHFLWSFAHSDPYKASGYDCLHFFDGGIWGRHMWVLLKEHLQRNGLATTFNEK